jgi:anthranilate phosphoribosyltransferase
LDALAGGDAKNNAEIVKNILAGKDDGPRKDIVVLNAAAAIIVGGLANDFASAVNVARQVIENGEAMHRLEKLVHASKG